MTELKQELSLFDVADMLWSHRLLLAIALAIGVAWSAFTFAQRPDPVSVTDLTIEVYPGGSPPVGQAEILGQIVIALAGQDVEILTPTDSAPLVVRVPAGSEGAIVSVMSSLTEALDDVAFDGLATLKAGLSAEAAPLDTYLRFKAYADGREMGLIEPIGVSQNTHALSDDSAFSLLAPIMLSLIFGLLLVLMVEGIRGWRRYRATKAS